jgi:hypothetical protein
MAGIGNDNVHFLVIFPVMAMLSSGNLPGSKRIYLLAIFLVMSMFILR